MNSDPGFNFDYEPAKEERPLFDPLSGKRLTPNRHHRRSFLRKITGRNAPCLCGKKHTERHTGRIVPNKRKDCCDNPFGCARVAKGRP